MGTWTPTKPRVLRWFVAMVPLSVGGFAIGLALLMSLAETRRHPLLIEAWIGCGAAAPCLGWIAFLLVKRAPVWQAALGLALSLAMIYPVDLVLALVLACRIGASCS